MVFMHGVIMEILREVLFGAQLVINQFEQLS